MRFLIQNKVSRTLIFGEDKILAIFVSLSCHGFLRTSMTSGADTKEQFGRR